LLHSADFRWRAHFLGREEHQVLRV
jgi:hypothetical protein